MVGVRREYYSLALNELIQLSGLASFSFYEVFVIHNIFSSVTRSKYDIPRFRKWKTIENAINGLFHFSAIHLIGSEPAFPTRHKIELIT